MNPQLDIVSIGMVTAVGLDAPSSCAAMRAGIDGFVETQYQAAPDEFLIGAPIPLERNWIGEKRAARLVAGAIAEALDDINDVRDRIALVLCVAEEERPGRPVRGYDVLLRRVSEIVEIQTPVKTRIIAHGRPSGHVALDYARHLLAERSVDYVMIAAVDTYLTQGSIAHFLDEQRLLTQRNPNGFIAGEAAAAVLCAPVGRGLLTLHGIGLSKEPAYIYNPTDLPLRGDGMTSAYRSALREAGVEMHQVGYRIADLIGEQYWFKQSTLAVSRLTRAAREFMDIWSPSESLGNVGAAATPIMLGMAFMAWKKNYSEGRSVLIEASSDRGACGAAVFAAGRPS